MINFLKSKFTKSKELHVTNSCCDHKKSRVSWCKPLLKPMPMRVVTLVLVFLIVLGNVNVVHANGYADNGFSEGGEEGCWTLYRLCSAAEAYKKKIEDIRNSSSDDEEYYDGVMITFWCPDLDSDGIPELVVSRVPKKQVGFSGVMTLFIYGGMYERNYYTGAEVYLICKIENVPIRCNFLMTKDGQAIYSIINSGTGQVDEGTVKLNDSRTDLIFSNENTYSIPDDEKSKYDTYSVSGYYYGEGENSKYNNWGPLKVKTLVMHDFTIGVDNFSFGNSLNKKVGGFYNVEDLKFTDEQYKDLTINDDLTNQIEYDISKKFGGACFGMCSLMAFAKQGLISASTLQSNASTIHDLSKPTDDEDLYCTLCYLNEAQHLESYYDEDYEDSIVECGDNLNKDQLQNLTEKYLSDDSTWMTLKWYGNGSGHALLVIGLEYFENLNVYRVKLYDVNSVTEHNPSGCFVYMYIKDDYSDFILRETNDPIKDKNYVSKLAAVSSDKTYSAIDKSLIIGKDTESQSENTSESSNSSDSITFTKVNAMLYFDFNTNLILEIEGKGTLKIENGIASSEDFDIKVCIPIVFDGLGGKSYNCIEIPKGESYTITCDDMIDIQLSAGDEYYALKGDMNGQILLSNNQIDISSASGEIEIGTLSDGKLVMMSGTASSGLSLKKSEDGTLCLSSEKAVNVKNVNFIGDNEKQVYENLGSKTSLELTAESMKSGSFLHSPIVIVIISVIVLAAIIVVVLKIHKKKTSNNMNRHLAE